MPMADFISPIKSSPRIIKISDQNRCPKIRAPLTLVIQADQAVTYDQFIHLTLLAREAGIQNALLATMPRAVTAPAAP